jgi:histidine ammonia-lyase
MQEARDVIERLVAAGEVVYGVTTGFGDLATTSIAAADAAQLQENLLVATRPGSAAVPARGRPGDAAPAREHARAGPLGLPPLLVDRLCELLRLGIHPSCRSRAASGASGDLAPLAHLALPLIGAGHVELTGRSCRRSSRSRGRAGAADARGRRRASRSSTGRS